VLTIVTNSIDIDNKKFSLYTFSSTEPHWSKPTRCFPKRGFSFVCTDAAVSHGVAHWFVTYYNEQDYYMVKHYIYSVHAETGHRSLIDLSIPNDQLNIKGFQGARTPTVDANGSLSLLFIYKEADIWRLDMWRRQTGADGDIWLLVKVLDLKPPRRDWDPHHLHMWSGEKSGTCEGEGSVRS
jgi:hypothetical protein